MRTRSVWSEKRYVRCRSCCAENVHLIGATIDGPTTVAKPVDVFRNVFRQIVYATTSYGNRSVVRAGYISYTITRSTDAGELNAPDTTANDFCFSCMRDAGVQAYEILAIPRDIEAGQLRDAGYSLNELMYARLRLPQLNTYLPVSKRTLFDSQLQDAGYSAKDFREANVHARELSYNWHWKVFPLIDDENLTPGEREWESTGAFFTARELLEAGYTEAELYCACFSEEDVRGACYAEDKHACDAGGRQSPVVLAKTMPRRSIQKKPYISAKKILARWRRLTINTD